ncbi:MAG: 2,3-bisphosphoglycerate-independent phosphoglycerate mutase [Clostridia bacterium]|nr:2,3-bisphosphoglycerate-independent phosphoglycerate mutase [Clostridia bacterium]
MSKKPLVLMILDGYGCGDKGQGDAIHAAATPNMDRLLSTCSNAQLECSGMAVGLPEGQMGNSEVGHTNIGAGRVVYQELTRITKSIQDGDFFANDELTLAIEKAKAQGGRVHLYGLLSTGGVHSHITHLFALIDMCEKAGVESFVHCFLDGRDVPPKSGADFVRQLSEKIEGTHCRIATVIGRYYAMDRDSRWERLELAYKAMVYGEGKKCDCPVKAVEESYAEGVTDEFVMPVVCCEEGKIESRDSVIFYNFRPDRAREITRSLVDPDFSGFERRTGLVLPHYVCFTQYDASMPNVHIAFKPQVLNNIFGEYIAAKGLTQLRIAETEKYAHVTFFFNGGEERSFEGEDRILVASPKVATYDLQPEMSAFEVTDKCCEAIESGKYDVVILNLANCDMVGHTGVFDAAVKAVEAVDTCVGKLVESVAKAGGKALITADHGNADKMLDEDGKPFTAHTTALVPVILVGDETKLRDGKLCDLAPTMLELLGLEQPAEITGESLLVR